MEGDMKEVEVEATGAFVKSLKRNNKEIREDRATAISEGVELKFKRSVEDLEVIIKDMKRQQENMLDMSPDNVYSLKPAGDINADKYVEDDLRLGLEIRNAEIKLDIARIRYEYLFGGTV